jgi:hypothetical protein
MNERVRKVRQGQITHCVCREERIWTVGIITSREEEAAKLDASFAASMNQGATLFNEGNHTARG